MPSDNYHAVKLKEPIAFKEKSIRVKEIADGISVTMGDLKSGGEFEIQSYKFDKEKFSPLEAKLWLKKNKIEYIEFEKAGQQVGKIQEFRKLTFLARVQEMSGSEIMSLIPKDIFTKIKEVDPVPEFRVYSIAHEGESKGNIVGFGNKQKAWYKALIEKVADKIQAGIKFFHLHNADNSHDGRMPLGEVVGKGIQKISNKLNALAVAYIYPEYRDMKLDVASMESNIVFSQDEKTGEIEVKDIEAITGIALGNSTEGNIPGFPGATLLGSLQAFRTERINGKGGFMAKFTSDEVKELIREAKLKPSDIFGQDELNSDPIVVSLIKDEVKGEYLHRTRVQKEFAEKSIAWDTEKKTLADKLNLLEKDAVKIKVLPVFETLATSRKLDDKQRKFISKSLPTFTPNDPNKINEEVDVFVTKELERYNEFAELLTGKKTEEVKPGTPGNDEKNIIKDYTDPSQNDFIPNVQTTKQ
jgi:hypothetical protein